MSYVEGLTSTIGKILSNTTVQKGIGVAIAGIGIGYAGSQLGLTAPTVKVGDTEIRLTWGIIAVIVVVIGLIIILWRKK